MLLALAVIIAVAWLLGFTVFHVASGAIHVLIVIAVIVAIVHFVQGRRAPLPMVNGRPVLFDANRTPGIGHFSKERYLPIAQSLAGGIDSFLRDAAERAPQTPQPVIERQAAQA